MDTTNGVNVKATHAMKTFESSLSASYGAVFNTNNRVKQQIAPVMSIFSIVTANPNHCPAVANNTGGSDNTPGTATTTTTTYPILRFVLQRKTPEFGLRGQMFLCGLFLLSFVHVKVLSISPQH